MFIQIDCALSTPVSFVLLHLRDKDSLYENDDETSVVTMYLTVSRGNSSEGTDHTWKEINSYSAYDYDKMGVDRYQTAALLQLNLVVFLCITA